MSWPSFSFPMGAWFFAVLIPVIIMYFLKLKRPRVEISSLALWQAVINDQRVNSPFQRFRRNLLLLLQLILLILIILALMQPFLSAGPETAEYLPILIDCSASMSARGDTDDTTRLDLAKEKARALIENLRGQGRIALFSFDTTGRRLTEFTDDQSRLLRALDKIKPSHRPGSLDEVLRMADAYSRSAPIERVVVITDGNLKESVDFELPFELSLQPVAAGGVNVGITEMNARRSDRESWEVFVRVSGSVGEVGDAELTLTMDDRVVGREQVSVSPDEPTERLVFTVDTPNTALLQAKLTFPGSKDSLDIDNSVWLSLPQPRPLKVRTSPDLYSWQHAFNVLEGIELDAAESPQVPEYDLIVSDSMDLAGIDAPILVYVGLVPDEISDLVSVAETEPGEEPTEVVVWEPTSTLLQHVKLRQVQIAEKARYVSGADEAKLEDRGYEVLVHGANGPLLLQKRQGLRTEYFFLFHTDRSTLPYRLAFPILVSNATQAALKQASLSEVSAIPTGVLPPIAVEPERSFTVSRPDGDIQTLQSTPSGMLSGISADVVGKYEIEDSGDLVATLGTGTLNSMETSLRSVDDFKFNDLSVEVEESELVEGDQRFWRILAFLAFAFLLIEWWYFQRDKSGAVA